MKLTAEHYEACEKHCWRNWRVRITPKSSRELIRDALKLYANGEAEDAAELRERLSEKVRDKHPRSWTLVLILLKWIVPIVIELVIEWWKRRQARDQ